MTTLRHHINETRGKGVTSQGGSGDAGRREVSVEVESQLTHCLCIFEKWGFGLSRDEVLDLVQLSKALLILKVTIEPTAAFTAATDNDVSSVGRGSETNITIVPQASTAPSDNRDARCFKPEMRMHLSLLVQGAKDYGKILTSVEAIKEKKARLAAQQQKLAEREKPSTSKVNKALSVKKRSSDKKRPLTKGQRRGAELEEDESSTSDSSGSYSVGDSDSDENLRDSITLIQDDYVLVECNENSTLNRLWKLRMAVFKSSTCKTDDFNWKWSNTTTYSGTMT
ncbi:hypothetical protein ILUMI_06447 [Ignelater luminosus]|uniref:Uncharacterized protein n=1 Tax=Ignelater luminosus TaxID=2038154 RepID=A0A8K0DA85_IGNLU|nr:hypothetical protein ILUMI_06447 [Ignelater luminosus]